MNAFAKSELTREVGQSARACVCPCVDISEGKDEYLLRADMPGVNKDGLEILLEGSELTIVGRKQPGPTEGQLLVRESTQHDYRRTFVLDPVIEASRISAQVDQGVLTLRLPKAEEVKPRKIRVTD
jgi:HSP20 family protein